MLKTKSNVEQFLVDLRGRLQSKREQLEAIHGLQVKLGARLEQFTASKNVKEAIQTRIDLNSTSLTIDGLEEEIRAAEKSLGLAQNDVDRQANEEHLVELGKSASEQRGKYEEIWKQIHGMLEQLAPEMVGAYQEWLKNSRDFCDLLQKIKPGAFDNNNWEMAERILLVEEAGAFLKDLINQKVDLPTVMGWHFKGSLPNNSINPKPIEGYGYELPPLDGAYLSALDFAHEVAQYGLELWPSVRRRYGIRYTNGKLIKYWVGHPLRRPFFPLPTEEIKKSLARLEFNKSTSSKKVKV